MDVFESEPHLIVERRDGVMILTMNRPAVRKIKEGVLRSSGLPLDQALAIEDEVSAAVMASMDAREGPRAFAEKRKPKFIGK